MARKFIDMEEAAQMLGVTTETLGEMRERAKIHGYRDGASWKFKPEEIERVIREREEAEQEGEFAEIDEDPDSILLSEQELGQSDDSTSSTIIGGSGTRNPAESDIQLAPPKADSDLDLDSALTTEPGSGGSDVLGGSDVVPGSGVSPTFDELDTLDLDLPSAADSGISSKIFSELPTEGSKASSGPTPSGMSKPEGSGLAFGSEDELSLGEADDDAEGDAALALDGEGDEELQVDTGDGGSAIDLAGDDDDGDLVLGGGGSGDLSRTGDSGISLLDPADSGLSLESAPLELGGSAVDSLDLGEDDMILTEDEAAEAEEAAATEASDEQSDDDFLLTPLEEANSDESDSGSQVIALDEDVEFEDAGGGLATEEAEAGDLLEGGFEEGLDTAAGGLDEGLGEVHTGLAATSAAAASAPAAGATATVPEAPFSGWSVVGLGFCSLILALAGMFLFDLLRNMWSWNEPYAVNSSLMDMVLSWFE